MRSEREKSILETTAPSGPVTGVGCPGIYTLDCYCDREADYHSWDEFPHGYTDERGSACRAIARREGWKLDYKKNIFLCPKCNPRSRRYIRNG